MSSTESSDIDVTINYRLCYVSMENCGLFFNTSMHLCIIANDPTRGRGDKNRLFDGENLRSALENRLTIDAGET